MSPLARTWTERTRWSNLIQQSHTHTQTLLLSTNPSYTLTSSHASGEDLSKTLPTPQKSIWAFEKQHPQQGCPSWESKLLFSHVLLFLADDGKTKIPLCLLPPPAAALYPSPTLTPKPWSKFSWPVQHTHHHP